MVAKVLSLFVLAFVFLLTQHVLQRGLHAVLGLLANEFEPRVIRVHDLITVAAMMVGTRLERARSHRMLPCLHTRHVLIIDA